MKSYRENLTIEKWSAEYRYALEDFKRTKDRTKLLELIDEGIVHRFVSAEVVKKIIATLKLK